MWEQTFPLDRAGKVIIDQTVGRVRAVTWDQPHVRISAHGDQPERYVRVRSSSRRVLVEIERPFVNLFAGGGPRIDLDLSLPPGCHLVIDNGAGRVEAEALDVRSLIIDAGVGAVSCSLSRMYRGGRYVIDTGAGEAKVRVPRNAGLDITIDHGLGRVSSAVGLANGRARINGGGATLVVHVGVGELDFSLGPEQPVDGPPPAAAAPPVAEPPPAATAPHVVAAPTVVAAPPVPEVPTVAAAPPVAEPPPVPEAPSVAAASPATAEVPGGSAADGDELHKVLRMVEEGKLSPDEADEILRVLEEGSE